MISHPALGDLDFIITGLLMNGSCCEMLGSPNAWGFLEEATSMNSVFTLYYYHYYNYYSFFIMQAVRKNSEASRNLEAIFSVPQWFNIAARTQYVF